MRGFQALILLPDGGIAPVRWHVGNVSVAAAERCVLACDNRTAAPRREATCRRCPRD